MKRFLLLVTVSTLSIVLNSCKNDFYSMDDFTRVEKIDTHMHLNSESPALTEQAIEDNFRLLDVSVDTPHYPSVEEQERFALHQIEKHPDRVKYLTAFTLHHWDSANWADEIISQLKNSFANGALGIKLWKNIGMVYKDSADHFIMLDNPKFDPVIQYIIDEDKTIMGHLGEPKNCWLPLDQMTVNNDRSYFKNNPEYHMFLHPEYPTYEEQIQARDNFLERHPDMRFVGAHLGSLEWDVDELAKRLDKFPNMAVDMAARIGHLQYQTQSNREKIREFFIKYQDRITYGTDASISDSSNPEEEKKSLHEVWLADWKYFVTDEVMTVKDVNGEFQGLKLPKEVIDKIYSLNAIHWFKI
ncbi:MAG: amidohydrolase family protein [Bacteroidia bacterium]|nr:amidohydrolase family protein [Bacteroidia bacterium]